MSKRKQGWVLKVKKMIIYKALLESSSFKWHNLQMIEYPTDAELKELAPILESIISNNFLTIGTSYSGFHIVANRTCRSIV